MLDIKDLPGRTTKADMRPLFEKAILQSPLAKTTHLGVMEINGQFSHYMDPDTDTLWIGFCLGYRTFEKSTREVETINAEMLKQTI